MHALSTSKLISIFSFSVVLLYGMSEADKQTASKGRKEAPPFLEITDRRVPFQAQRPTNESIAPLDNPRDEKQPLENHLNDNETDENPAAPSSYRKMPYFLIFNVPRLTPDQDPDYGWSIWSDWTPCSAECRVQSRHFRVRHCELPPADLGGGASSSCVGEDTQWKTCAAVPCAGSAKQGQGGGGGGGEAEEVAKENADWKRPRHGGVSPAGIDLAQTVAISASGNKEEEDEEMFSWHRCRTPCPFEIYLRERWCFVGMYCVGDRKEARVCTQRFGLIVCSDVHLASFDPTSDTNGDGRASDSPSARPWVDTRIGWSSWTPWAICSDDCFYHVQELNASRRPCPEGDTGGGGGGGGRTRDCAVDGGEPKELRICRGGGGGGGGADFEYESSIICGPIGKLSTWKVAEDFKTRKVFASYNGRIVHGIVVLLLFGPLVILIFYWLVARSRRPRYESLPSAATNSIYVSTQPTISTDASSAVGQNYILVEENPKTWKTV